MRLEILLTQETSIHMEQQAVNIPIAELSDAALQQLYLSSPDHSIQEKCLQESWRRTQTKYRKTHILAADEALKKKEERRAAKKHKVVEEVF